MQIIERAFFMACCRPEEDRCLYRCMLRRDHRNNRCHERRRFLIQPGDNGLYPVHESHLVVMWFVGTVTTELCMAVYGV
jgi:hypothetical protein